MSLADQAKTELIERIGQLIRDDEPEAVIEELCKWAVRRAQERNRLDRKRWRALATALMEANSLLAEPPEPAGPDFSPEAGPDAHGTAEGSPQTES